MSIKDWPKNERPREKLLHLGAENLSDAELLAIFLRTGIKGQTALDIGRSLLKQFGNLRNLLKADYKKLCQHPGLGITKYVQLQASLEISKRHLSETLEKKPILSNIHNTKMYLKSQLGHHTQEVFACLFLNIQHHILSFEKLFYGTIDGTSIHPREIIKRALQYNAAAIILAHNHPSGITDPSSADRHVTQQLKIALEMIDVQVLDHIIVAENQAISFSELGLL